MEYTLSKSCRTCHFAARISQVPDCNACDFLGFYINLQRMLQEDNNLGNVELQIPIHTYKPCRIQIQS